MQVFSVFAVRAPIQNKFQAHANRVAKAKAIAKKAAADLKVAQEKFFSDCDKVFGDGSYVIYESRAPYPSMRLSRRISQPREIAEERLRELCNDDQWNAVTVLPPPKRRFDLQAFDAAVASGIIPAAVANEVTSYGSVPSLIWEATASRTKYPLEAGQMAIVALSDAVAQES